MNSGATFGDYRMAEKGVLYHPKPPRLATEKLVKCAKKGCGKIFLNQELLEAHRANVHRRT